MDESLYLKKNVGPVDRIIRFLIGSGLIVLPVFFRWPFWAAVVAAALGGAMLVEGIISY